MLPIQSCHVLCLTARNNPGKITPMQKINTKAYIKRYIRMALICSALGVLGLAVARFFTARYASTRISSVKAAPHQPVAIVFGAGLRRDGSPTAVLRERITTAADLYRAGKVDKLLLSGDNSVSGYNEPEAMRRYAISLGMPDEDLVLDNAGRRSYDTCYRARTIFNVRHAILVTQPFHLPRTLYTCNSLGVDSVGVPADRLRYHRALMTFWNLRETFATLIALWEVNVSHPTPILGKPEPIFPHEVQL